jgi:LysM repeat protein
MKDSQFSARIARFFFNLGFILTKNTDFDPPLPPFFGNEESSKGSQKSKSRIFKFDVIKLFLVLLSLALPLNTEASDFSILNFILGEKADASVTEYSFTNSQKIEVLEAVNSPSQKIAIGGAEIEILDDSVLVAQPGAIVGIDEPSNSHYGKISIYEVKEGDTLSGIASMFDVSVNTIRWANSIDKGITPGQTLVILPISGIQYKVAKGDTISSIAKKYKADASEIALYNNIAISSELKSGEIVVIPHAEPETLVAKKTGNKVTTKKENSGPSIKGYYIHPVPGSVRTQGLHGYNGVDFGAPTGTSVLASATGNVIVSRVDGWNGGYGKYVIIAHANGTQTVYAHLNALNVSVGDEVSQGELIGYVGSTGNSTGPHLHFEIRGAKNPWAY